ncbi:MAG TPA: DUF2784 domain-containing protein [Verrucomicrobiae bacterium]|jgi:hypothetical protein|nr:DUF2784 domain-containing protein [Verrucomicrobiae bacterium]
MQIYHLGADAVLLLHFAFVLFVVLSLPLIALGRWRGWEFVRNVWFRAAHLCCIGLVTAESLAGMVCPLTTWENQLRLKAGGGLLYEGSFMQHWIHRVMFFQASESIFTVLYVAFLAAVLACFWWVKPRWHSRL